MAPTLKRKRGAQPELVVPKQQPRQATPESDAASALDASDADADMDEAGEGEEEEEFKGFGGDAGAGVGADEGGARGAKKRKVPTGNEVRAIREAAELFQSSTFKLQIDALLPNVRLKPSRRAPLDAFLLSLHGTLTSAPAIAPSPPLKAAKALLKTHKIGTPWPFPPPPADANWKVAFSAPTELVLAGSYALQASVKPPDGLPWIVDLAVEMPAALFQEKDYLNGRALHKRAFFLSALAAHLSAAGLGAQLAWAGAAREAALLLDPRIPKLNARVRILPVLPAAAPIPLAKLAPHRSNLRIADADAAPTPLYNTALLRLTTPRPHLLAAHALASDAPGVPDALALLRVWAHQRGFGAGALSVLGSERLGGAFWGALLEALVRGEEPMSGTAKAARRPLGKGLSSFQLFRAALSFLASHDWDAGVPVFVKSAEGHRFAPQEYGEHHGAALVDGGSRVNLLAGVPSSSLNLLKHDAQVTLAALNAPTSADGAVSSEDPFAATFLHDARPLPARFDAVLRVSLAHAAPLTPSALAAAEHGSPSAALLASIASTLTTALGPRVKAAAVLVPASPARALNAPDAPPPSEITIGLLYDPAHAARLVDLGPPASSSDDDAPSEEQKAFAHLWGPRAELRRFKDGRIAHAAVWDALAPSADARARLPAIITSFILGRHFSIPASDVSDLSEGLDGVLRLPRELVGVGARQAGFGAARAAFDNLAKALRALPEEDMPLGVTGVAPTTAYLRGTAPLAPLAAVRGLPAAAAYAPAMPLVLELARAGRWPDDVAVAGKMKLALLERLARALSAALPGLSARIAVPPPGVSGLEDHARLELLTKDGWAFSVALDHPREATLLRRAIAAGAQIPKAMAAAHAGAVAEAERAKGALEYYVRTFVAAPRLHRALSALGHRESAFAGTARLVKRWLASHWLLDLGGAGGEGGLVGEEALELLVARVFLAPSPPASRERGFAAAVRWLAGWDFSAPVNVPLFSEARADPHAPAEREEDAEVEVEVKGGVWRVVTEVDAKGTMWTAAGPDAVVARRVREVARATWAAMAGGDADAQALFAHPTDDYDFVLHLDPRALPRHFEAVSPDASAWSRTGASSGKYANAILDVAEGEGEVRVGWDPAAAFVRDLRAVYKDSVRLFCDPLGGARIGGVWEPALRTARPFRVLGRFNAVPVEGGEEGEGEGRRKKGKGKEEGGMVVLNEAAVVEEIVRMGRGLVKA